MNGFAYCPICHQVNNCGNGNQETCWCRNEFFPSEIFDLVPTEQMRKACICKVCLESFRRTIKHDEWHND